MPELEPSIIINGTPLTPPQAMSVRVAIGLYLMELQNPECLGKDETGMAIAQGYKSELQKVSRLMHTK